MDKEITRNIFLIALVVLAVFFLYKKFINPAPVNHDSTLLFTGGLGSGKTKNSVAYVKKAYRRVHRSWWLDCKKKRIGAVLRGHDPDAVEYAEEPGVYSNIPIWLGGPISWLFRNRHADDDEWLAKHWSRRLTRNMMIFKTRIPVGSVVFIDELPQFINQFQYDAKGVKDVLNEWITFFRHYIDGLFVANAQSLDEVECHIRRKLNVYYYCFDFTPILGIFYRVRIIRNRVGDASISLDSQYLEDNARWHYGLLIFSSYDSRCYRHRYDYVVERDDSNFDDMCTNEILRFDPGYYSPIDELIYLSEHPNGEVDDSGSVSQEAEAHD